MSRRALLVGVQRSKAAQLRGPENDVEAMQEVLETERFGFHVRTLQDPHKKRTDIETAVAELVQATREGDSLLFYYSGHGTHVTVRNRTETDCEALVPSDYKDGLDHLAIKEFELHEWLRPAVEKGAKVTAILDCCFSGGMAVIDRLRGLIQLGGECVRDAFRSVPGELVEDLGLIGVRALLRPGISPKSPPDSHSAELSTFAHSSTNQDSNGVVVFGACNAEEIALEREFDNMYMGVFTHALVRAMRNLPLRATNVNVRDAVRRLIDGALPKQTPITYPSEPDAFFLT
jgi:hypothetical protein